MNSSEQAAQGGITVFAVELRTPRWELLVDWYRRVLGLKVLIRIDEDRYALCAAGPTRLALLGRASAPPPSDRWSLVLEVDDLDGMYRRLAEAGAAEGAPREDAEGIRRFAARDPEGNRLHLFAWPR